MVDKVTVPLFPVVAPQTLDGVLSAYPLTTRQTLTGIRAHAWAINELISLQVGGAGQPCRNIIDYGAVSGQDSTKAILAAEADAAPGDVVLFPPGEWLFSSTITVSRQRPLWRGTGPYQTILRYVGASTTNDLIVLGNGTDPIIGGVLADFRITSNTTMTAGYALRLRKCGRLMLRGVVVEGQDGTTGAVGSSKLYHGAFFDEVDNTYWVNFEACASKTAVLVRGAVGTGAKADLYLLNGKISSSDVGLHIGGAFGGTYFNNLNIIFNNTCVLINEALSNEVNREIMFGDCAIDSAMGGQLIKIDCPSDMTNAWIRFNSTWMSSSLSTGADPLGIGVWVKDATGASILFTGCRISFNKRDGIRVDDAGALVFITNCFIENNDAYGINPNVGSNSTVVGPCCFNANVSGDIRETNLNVSNNVPVGTISSWYQTNSLLFAVDSQFIMKLLSTNPAINFDANDYMEYDRSTNELKTNVSSTLSQTVGDGYTLAPIVQATDAAFNLQVSGSDAILQFDTNDYIRYDRSNNEFLFHIGGNAMFLVKNFGTLHLAGQANDPTSPAAGQIYYNSATGKFRGYNGTAWQDFN
jgi:hypothetical protein